MVVLAEPPAPNSKQRLQRFARLPGGQIATSLVACQRLGWTTAYAGRFGDDDFGTLSRQTLIDAGVDVSAARVIRGATNRFAVILVDARTGDRTVLWDSHPSLTMEAADVAESAATAGRLLIVDGSDTSAATQAAKYARAADIATILDVERVRPGMGELLQHIDAIITAQGFPTELTGYDEVGRALAALADETGAPLVCVTLGGEGSLARCGGREIRTPAFKIDCVDSTGAGDAFRAGFAAGCLSSPDGAVEDVLRYANAVAALNCRALGAQTALPTPAEVERLLM